MELIISDDVRERFSPIIGLIRASDIDNATSYDEVGSLLEDAAAQARDQLGACDSPQQHPLLAAWRQAYREFGSNPKSYRCSAEALARRAIQGDELPRIGTLVDLYNVVSLRHLLPIGGEDASAIDGDLELALACGDEPFVRLNGTENEPPEPGEVIYRDGLGTICRRWNWREADRTKLTGRTTAAVLVIDGIDPADASAVETATTELAALIERFCGGSCAVEILR